MENQTNDLPLEIILFFIDDESKQLENILPVFKKNNEGITPKKMLEICTWSIRKAMPSASITLFTDSHTNIHDTSGDLSVVRFTDIRHDKLMFDLQRIRMEYIADQMSRGVFRNYILTDIDVYFNKSMAHLFKEDFDIASPATFHDQKYSPRGVPYNSLMSIINGGLWFVKPSQKVLVFYKTWLETMLHLEKTDDLLEYGDLAKMVKKDFLKWWGEPHSLMVMFADFFAAGELELIDYHGTLFRILDESIYNYAPDQLTDSSGHSIIKITSDDLKKRFLFHFRGGRKLFMADFAKQMGAPN